MDVRTFTLDYLRRDGTRDYAELERGSLDEARMVARWVLLIAHGLYTKAEIRVGGWPVETVEHTEGGNANYKEDSILIQ